MMSGTEQLELRQGSESGHPRPFKIPALRSLGKLADFEPVIICDNREIQPLVFTRLSCIRGTLLSGDYSLRGLENEASVERKGSLTELASCCMGNNRERFERELHRLRGMRFKRLLIVGSVDEVLKGEYRSNITPKAILWTLAAFEVRYNLPVVWEQSPESAARRVEGWFYWYAREIAESANSLFRGCQVD